MSRSCATESLLWPGDVAVVEGLNTATSGSGHVFHPWHFGKVHRLNVLEARLSRGSMIDYPSLPSHTGGTQR